MRLCLFIFLAVFALMGCRAAPEAPAEWADAIYANGHIWTGNPDNPWASALAVKGDKIVAMAPEAASEALSDWQGDYTDFIDLGGKFVVPGFQDSHIHLMYNAAAQVDLAGADTIEEIEHRISRFAAAHPDLPWIQGFGWGYGAFPQQRPLAAHLDAVIADRPVFMVSRDGHMALANSLAIEMAGIDSNTADPENGRIVRGQDGEVTGEFQEKAAALIRRLIPPPNEDERYQALLAKMDEAAAAGITAVHEAGVNPDNISIFERALSEGKLLQRVELALRMVTPENRKDVPRDAAKAHIAEAKALTARLTGPYLRVRSVKGMLDGTIDATTAAMFDNYVGTDTPGIPFWDVDTLKQTAALYDAAGFQLILHAIGDRAISDALDVFDYAQAVNGERDARHRVEHAEMPRVQDLARFRALGVIASTQPMFAYPDTTVLENFAPLLGHDRAQHADNFALWDDAGVRQVFGSDNPVMTLSALKGIEAAVTRMTEAGDPPGGWYPQGKISAEAALRHYTSDSAWGTHDEAQRGTLEVGKFADFVVLSHNILEIDPTQISETQVLKTVMGGRITFTAKE